MSLRNKIISVFASAMVLGSAAVAVSAQDQAPAVKDDAAKSEKLERKGFRERRGGGFGKGMHGGMRGLMGIELSDAQKTQIKQIYDANRPDQATMDELKAIHDARRAGTITEDQKARAKTLRGEMRSKGESVHQQVLAVLTPEQIQQIETRKAEMQKRREERRQLREQKRQTLPPATTNKTTDI